MREGRDGGEQESMFVSIVETVETPQRFIPTVIRFERVDGIFDILPQSLYFSSELGRCVLLGTLANREARDPADGRPIIGEHELPNHMVKNASEIVDDVPNNGRNRERNLIGFGEIPFHLPRLMVMIGPNFVGVAIQKSVDRCVEFCNVLIGPIGFGPQLF